jgi:hypothetical protein
MKIQRIVVRLDPAPRGRNVLQAAAALAGKLEVELLGLYVENMDLLHFAGLPFAREVGVYSAKVRRLDVAAMERCLRAHAKQAGKLLAIATRDIPVRWSFRVARASEPDARIGHTDLVVAQLAHVEEMNRAGAARVVRAGDVSALRDALARENGGVLVLAGSDDTLMGDTLRRLRDT